MSRGRLARRLLSCALIGLCAAAPARAAVTQTTMMQDDNHLLFAGADTAASTLDTMKGLGVDTVRVSVFWRTVAPASDSATRPAFDATDPAAYPAQGWERYDTVVRLAAERGMGVELNLTSPAPDWAVGPGGDPTFMPSPQEFGAFVTAVGRRYSGSYAPPQVQSAQSGSGGLLGLGAPATPAPAPPASAPLPAVTDWSIWNEPNQPGWLSPQSTPTADVAPRLYRGLVDSAWSGLAASGHGSDTILIGETAPQGEHTRAAANAIEPLRFIRGLYCVDDSLHPLQGDAATALDCPTAGGAGAFAAQHPGLFAAAGFAHHPYSLIQAPSIPSPSPDAVSLADVPRLERTLDAVFSAYARNRRIPIYLTEYGYQTHPPDPTQLYSPVTQGRFLNQADYLTFRDPRVRALSQFQLLDDPPNAGAPPGSRFYWSTFQSGLEFADGSPKASLAAFRLPIWLPRARVRAGRPVTVWGLLRPAPNGSAQRARIQFRAGSAGTWRNLRAVGVHSARGSFTTAVRVPRSGALRIAWTAHGSTLTSREAAVYVSASRARAGRRARR